MRCILKNQISSPICGFIFLMAIFLLSAPAEAATIDDIIAMHDAGVSGDIIVDVIEATSLDEEMDADAILFLESIGLDPIVLDYLKSYYDIDPGDFEGSDYTDDENSTENHWNYYGGDGFNHNGGRYGRENDSNRSAQYSGRYDGNYNTWSLEDYLRNYRPDGGIYIYEPPVYRLYSNPYGAYYSPRYYTGGYGYCSPYSQPYYGGYGYGHHGWNNGSHRYYRDGWVSGFGGSVYNRNWRHRFDSGIDAFFSDDDWGIRISF